MRKCSHNMRAVHGSFPGLEPEVFERCSMRASITWVLNTMLLTSAALYSMALPSNQ